MSVAHNVDEKVRTEDVHISETINFAELLLSDEVLEGLRKSGFKRPSPIQLKAIPLGRCGLDLIVQAKSGTGKTCVFTVIALEGIDVTTPSSQVLVLAPTREIAIQIAGVMETIGGALCGLKVCTFIGGTSLADDKVAAKRCHIAVGTPGRLKQLIELGFLKTSSFRLLVLDEADKLLVGDFVEPINWIYSSMPDNKQILALSATYPEYLACQLAKYMRNPTFVRLNISDPALIGIKQYHHIVPHHPLPNKVFASKMEVIMEILSSVDFQQCLVFSNFQSKALSLQAELQSHGWPTVCIAGCLDQKERNFAISQLKTYQCRILISTDLTSRGIDADRVNLVINLDVPKEHETYLHRIGRAGRFGNYGAAISIVSEGGEDKSLWAVERKCNTRLPKLPDPIPKDLVVRKVTVNLSDVVSTEKIMTHPEASIEALSSSLNTSSHYNVMPPSSSFAVPPSATKDGLQQPSLGMSLSTNGDAQFSPPGLLADDEMRSSSSELLANELPSPAHRPSFQNETQSSSVDAPVYSTEQLQCLVTDSVKPTCSQGVSSEDCKHHINGPSTENVFSSSHLRSDGKPLKVDAQGKQGDSKAEHVDTIVSKTIMESGESLSMPLLNGTAAKVTGSVSVTPTESTICASPSADSDDGEVIETCLSNLGVKSSLDGLEVGETVSGPDGCLNWRNSDGESEFWTRGGESLGDECEAFDRDNDDVVNKRSVDDSDGVVHRLSMPENVEHPHSKLIILQEESCNVPCGSEDISFGEDQMHWKLSTSIMDKNISLETNNDLRVNTDPECLQKNEKIGDADNTPLSHNAYLVKGKVEISDAIMNDNAENSKTCLIRNIKNSETYLNGEKGECFEILKTNPDKHCSKLSSIQLQSRDGCYFDEEMNSLLEMTETITRERLLGMEKTTCYQPVTDLNNSETHSDDTRKKTCKEDHGQSLRDFSDKSGNCCCIEDDLVNDDHDSITITKEQVAYSTAKNLSYSEGVRGKETGKDIHVRDNLSQDVVAQRIDPGSFRKDLQSLQMDQLFQQMDSEPLQMDSQSVQMDSQSAQMDSQPLQMNSHTTEREVSVYDNGVPLISFTIHSMNLSESGKEDDGLLEFSKMPERCLNALIHFSGCDDLQPKRQSVKDIRNALFDYHSHGTCQKAPNGDDKLDDGVNIPVQAFTAKSLRRLLSMCEDEFCLVSELKERLAGKLAKAKQERENCLAEEKGSKSIDCAENKESLMENNSTRRGESCLAQEKNSKSVDDNLNKKRSKENVTKVKEETRLLAEEKISTKNVGVLDKESVTENVTKKKDGKRQLVEEKSSKSIGHSEDDTVKVREMSNDGSKGGQSKRKRKNVWRINENDDDDEGTSSIDRKQSLDKELLTESPKQEERRKGRAFRKTPGKRQEGRYDQHPVTECDDLFGGNGANNIVDLESFGKGGLRKEISTASSSHHWKQDNKVAPAIKGGDMAAASVEGLRSVKEVKDSLGTEGELEKSKNDLPTKISDVNIVTRTPGDFETSLLTCASDNSREVKEYEANEKKESRLNKDVGLQIQSEIDNSVNSSIDLKPLASSRGGKSKTFDAPTEKESLPFPGIIPEDTSASFVSRTVKSDKLSLKNGSNVFEGPSSHCTYKEMDTARASTYKKHSLHDFKKEFNVNEDGKELVERKRKDQAASRSSQQLPKNIKRKAVQNDPTHHKESVCQSLGAESGRYNHVAGDNRTGLAQRRQKQQTLVKSVGGRQCRSDSDSLGTSDPHVSAQPKLPFRKQQRNTIHGDHHNHRYRHTSSSSSSEDDDDDSSLSDSESETDSECDSENESQGDNEVVGHPPPPPPPPPPPFIPSYPPYPPSTIVYPPMYPPWPNSTHPAYYYNGSNAGGYSYSPHTYTPYYHTPWGPSLYPATPTCPTLPQWPLYPHQPCSHYYGNMVNCQSFPISPYCSCRQQHQQHHQLLQQQQNQPSSTHSQDHYFKHMMRAGVKLAKKYKARGSPREAR